jgi:predicted alpha/beta superfamily hydrolase
MAAVPSDSTLPAVAGRLVQTAARTIAGFPAAYPLTIYVPPGYDEGVQRYPVAYLFDGQNLFGHEGTYAGGWHLHEALDARAAKGKTVPLVVGIHHGGVSRLSEFTPWPIAGHPAWGDAFLGWVVETIVPAITAGWRVLTGPAHTLIGGSSLGGLMSLYGFLHHPEVFGRVLAMSPSVWVQDREMIKEFERLPMPAARRLYVDAGGRELPRTTEGCRALIEVLEAKGCVQGEDLMWRPVVKDGHNERAWRRRAPKALRYFYGG